MWDGAKNPGSKRINSFTRSHAMRGNGTKGKTLQGGKGPNNPKARGLNPKGTLSKRGLLLKGANPKEMLVGSQKGLASTTMRWGILQRLPQTQIREWGF
jgi:hypothetical protein